MGGDADTREARTFGAESLVVLATPLSWEGPVRAVL